MTAINTPILNKINYSKMLMVSSDNLLNSLASYCNRTQNLLGEDTLANKVTKVKKNILSAIVLVSKFLVIGASAVEM